MSVAVWRSSASLAFESILALPAAAAFSAPKDTRPAQKIVPALREQDLDCADDNKADGEAERPPGQFDIWSSIQAQKAAAPLKKDEPYVHPLVRRSSSLLSEESLGICTESLGSETGSDFFSPVGEADFFSKKEDDERRQQKQEQEAAEDCDDDEDEEIEYEQRVRNGRVKEMATVNYHCSIGRRSSPPRSFPPPLPSISRRDGPCLQMRPHRRDGRLVVEAVSVPSQNYLHAERQNGRLLLSFINTTINSAEAAADETEDHTKAINNEKETQVQAEEIEEEEEEEEESMEEVEEEEEEVEVVDRGTVVEVKVSTQPQQNSRATAIKVHRSSIVINKFVSCKSLTNHMCDAIAESPAATAAPALSPVRRLSTATTTAAAAAVAASSLSSQSAGNGSHSSTTDNKLLFTSRRRNREEVMHDMRRCSQLRKPLFIWEPCCIATSS